MPEPIAQPVFLIGFMAVGKTSVGQRAAQIAGLPFVDLDARIADRAGYTIAEIFARRGEDEFRALEAQALRQVAAGPPAIVATGGGAACHGDNLSVMRERGLVIALSATLETIRARIAAPHSTEPQSDGATRPLFARPLFDRPPAEVEALYRSRQSFYRQAHAWVVTDERTVSDVATRVLAIAECARSLGSRLPADQVLARTTFVGAGERPYPIVVAADALESAGAICRATLPGSCHTLALLSDDNVAPLYAERVQQSLSAAGFAVTRAVIPAGEQSKSLGQFGALCETLAPQLDRRSAIVALGGGVVGDLAGLVAATLFRGIACVQIPTSLLAMTDSAIGGKTGINLTHGKNLVGAFWQPRAVIADPTVLSTLPGRELRAAFGELLKYGLLAGEPLFTDIEELAPAIADGTATGARTLPHLTRVIARCAADKALIVTRDEREQTGERALLNLGHTVGHAIEAAGEYRTLLHGEAVALGLIAACRISAQLELEPAGLASDEASDDSGARVRDLQARVTAILARARLSTDLQPWMRSEVLERVRVDKKRTGRTIGFIAVLAPGDCRRVSLPVDKIVRKLLVDFTV